MMDEKFLKPYDPQSCEDTIYALWEKSGYFNPDTCIEKGVTQADAPTHTITLPPPNVTGVLHIGHAYEDTLQDALTRFARMRGKRTLWVPGTDSAAIATQARVEKNIQKEEKKSRHDLGREELVRRVNAFALEHEGRILGQVRKVGASLDWSRYAYTLDEKRYHAVMTAFVRMYEAGLIYRGHRIVNWDPKGQTTISDDEIVYEEEKTKFYHFQYGPFVIGTARPETKFGDKYVVMHPDDKRYKQYTHGEQFTCEWINGPITATVIKDEAIDMAFGTGVMTITPAHSMVDFEIAQRHHLDAEQVIDRYGKLLPIAGEFAGMKIDEARDKIVEKLRQKGLIVQIDDPYVHNIARAERSNGIIEPQIMDQWFIGVDRPFTMEHSDIPGIASGTTLTLKELMRASVEHGGVNMPQESFRKRYFHWIDNLHDWCISRQIWFGHRIPVWYRNTGIRNQESGIRNAETTEWEHKIYGKETYENIRNGSKRYEARIGKPAGTKGDWSEHKPGHTIHFTLVESNKEETPIERGVRKRIVAATHYATIEDMLKAIDLKEIAPDTTKEAYIAWATKQFPERYPQYGIWAFELEPVEQKEIYVGTEAPEGEGWEQDPDVLDTWFSSALWTFSTLGWPEETPDLATYHPTTFMSPAYEILNLWVSRMILMSGFHLSQVPFKTVLIHGVVRDKQGRKFSKSLGNGIDPLDVIKEYGADALRMGLMVGTAIGNDVSFDLSKIKGYKNFANKLWNVTRFVLQSAADTDLGAHAYHADDQVRVDELTAVAKEITEDFEAYRLYLAAEKIYHYIWHTFADSVLEESKLILQGEDAERKASRARMLYDMLLMQLKLLHPFMPFVTEEIWQALPKKDGDLLMVSTWPS